LYNKGWNLAKLGKYNEQLGDKKTIQRYKEAIEYFDKTLALNPDYLKARRNKDRALKKVLDSCDKAINENPGHANV
jgi:tetratricopeptide (TPR) repeat protein